MENSPPLFAPNVLPSISLKSVLSPAMTGFPPVTAGSFTIFVPSRRINARPSHKNVSTLLPSLALAGCLWLRQFRTIRLPSVN
ncbi:MAG: hypothetical protein HPZ91_08655 [Lentisphaeria bacterium]|nr:hypothetical protein [Lentisphaeria bacterium]